MKFRSLSWFILLIFVPAISKAWSFTGHVVIAQIAYANLTPEVRTKADTLASIIFYNLPYSQQEKLNHRYSNTSIFAKVAVLPDLWRNWKLKTIFTKYQASIPINLLLSSNQSTANWHFTNTPYPASSCKLMHDENIAWALEKVRSDLSQANNNNTRAILLVMEEHYIGDIHQPLHTISRYDHNCNNDKGGNTFCIKLNRHGKCTKSLHSLWDAGVGFLKPHVNIQQLAYDLQQSYPKTLFANELSESVVTDWVKDNYIFATFIYSLDEDHKPSQEYYKQGQLIAKRQLVIAGYRLAQELNANLK